MAANGHFRRRNNHARISVHSTNYTQNTNYNQSFESIPHTHTYTHARSTSPFPEICPPPNTANKTIYCADQCRCHIPGITSGVNSPTTSHALRVPLQPLLPPSACSSCQLYLSPVGPTRRPLAWNTSTIRSPLT